MGCIYKIKLIVYILGNLIGISVVNVKAADICRYRIRATTDIYSAASQDVIL